MRRVFVSGCYDRLHPGHIEFLRYARSLGDHLTVSVGSDATIRLLKNREPIFNQVERVKMLEALSCVDYAFVPDCDGADDCFMSVELLRPDVWVINHEDANVDWKVQLAKQHGVEIVFNARPANYHSTTQLIQSIGERQ